MKYGNYIIEPDEVWGFIFAHEDYSGDEDYCGTGNSVEHCKEQIDERIETE